MSVEGMDHAGIDIPKVLIVDISANFGGANARVLSLIKSFPKDRIGLATIEDSVIASELEQAGFQVHRLATRKFDWRILFRMVRIVRDYGYQILDTQNPQSKLWGSLAAYWAGSKLISTLNSWYMNEHPKYSSRWFIYTGMEFLTNFALSRYIVVSREIEAAMLKAGIAKNKIDLVYNAVDIDASLIKDNREWLVRNYDLPADAVICLAAGRLAWAKAHDDLISAVAQVDEGKSKLVCLIAGEGELQARLIEQIAELGMQKKVFLLGHLNHDELLSTLKASDIYVMPSRTEGTPVALLEAAALGKPIVASAVGGIPELVTHNEHALLVPVGDVTSLAAALTKLIEKPLLAAELAAKARQRVTAQFSLVSQARATALAYQKACQQA
jgi:glycosyltransferase involved in cell wall biosynthesis